ncbi:MAG: concanavalin [Leptospira sp.]|nr:concanavalin [Leptospira sp.]
MRKFLPILIFFLVSCQLPSLVRSQLELFGFFRFLGGANRFLLGGTVSGLLPGGSVEVRNGDQSVTVSQDGSFSFPTRLDPGTSYDLTISTSGNSFMNCAITNGKGVVQSVDISDVTINCGLGPGFYEVGVNVSGISAPITVQNNGTDSLSISSGGLFKFATPLSTGQNYSVTITSQTPGSVCSFVNPTLSAGTVATLNVTVAIRCISGYLNSGAIHTVAAADLFPNLSSPHPYLQTIAGSFPTNANGIGPDPNLVNDPDPRLARFRSPNGIVSDGTYIYIADYLNNVIRRMNISTQEVETFAGGATGGGIACPGANCQDGIGTAAQFHGPYYLTTDGVSLYVLEFLGNRIRRINLANAAVSTLAGSGNTGFADNANGLLASFSNPHGILLHQGTLYVADRYNERIRAVNPVTGAVTTLAGSGTAGTLDANGTSAQFNSPIGIAAVGGYLYIADNGSHRIRRIDLTSPYPVTTIAGQALAGSLDGYGTNAMFDGPFNLTSDGTNLILFEFNTLKIRHIRLSDYKVTTLVGGVSGYIDNAGSNAGMFVVAFPASDGNNLYISDAGNHAIRRIENAEILRYTFDGNMVDSVGTNNGSAVGAPTQVTDEKGTTLGAYELNGSSHLISSASNVNFSGNPIMDDLTMSMWVHPSGKAGNQFLFYNGSGGSNGYGILFDGTNTSRRISISLGGVPGSPDSTDQLPLNQWSHVTLTRNGGTWQMYINGRSQGIAFATNPNTPAASLKIGDNGGGVNFFQGKVSDFRFFKGALDQIAIQKLAAQVPNGLVAYYPLNGNSNDFSGNDNHLTINIATATSDRNGYGNSAYAFDGTTFLSRTSTVALPSGNARRTQCAWILTTSSISQHILGYGSNVASNGSGLMIDTTQAGIFGGGGGDDVLAPHEGITGEWVHICGTYDNANASLYLNGVLRNTESKTWNTTANTAIQVGRRIDFTGNFFGSIDDVRIYNRVLSQAEIRALSGVHPTQVSTWSTTIASRSLKFFLKPEATAYSGGTCPVGLNCVYDWYDRSGNNFHLTQISGANRPAYEINPMLGKPGIRFFGTDPNPSFLSRTCEPILNGSSNTIFATYREVGQSGNDGLFQNGSPTTGKLLYILRMPNRPSLFNLSSVNVLQATPNFSVVNETSILSLDHNGTSGNIRKNGSIQTSLSVPTGTFSCGGGTLDIGRYFYSGGPPDGDYFDGHLGDFLYFDGVLSAADRELVQCYLSNRYNIPVSHNCP